MRSARFGAGRRGRGAPPRRAHRVPVLLGGLLVLAVLLGVASAGYEGTSPLELRADGPPVGIVSNVITGPVRAVLPAAHVAAIRTPPSLAPASFTSILLLLALLGGLATVTRTSWAGAWQRRPIRADAAIAHAIPAAWRGPPRTAR